MKKKRKKVSLETVSKNRYNLKIFEKILKKLRSKVVKDFIFVTLLTFIISTAITIQRQPIKTHKSPGDAYYYYKNAELFSKVWQSPFYYFSGLLFNTLSNRELLEIGFNHQSDFDSFFRAPGYISFLSLWIVIFGKSELAALLSQCFLLSLLVGFIYLIIQIFLNNRLFGFIGVFFSLLYLTFYISALQTMTELFQALSLMIFFYGLILFLVKKQSNRKRDYFILAFLFILVHYSKMSMKFLYVLIIPFIIYFIFGKYKNSRKLFKKYTITFLISFFLLVVFFNLMLSRGSGGIESANLGGWRNYWAGSCRLADGFGINTAHHEKEFRDNLNKGTRKFWFNRYSEVSKYAVIDTLKNHPYEFIVMTLKKIGLLLTYPPQNYQSISLLITARQFFMHKYHIILLIISFLLIFIFYNYDYDNPKKLFILKIIYFLVVGYLSILFGLSNPGTRYFLPIVPFYLIFSSIGLYYFLKYKIYKNKSFFYTLVVITVSMILIANINLLNLIFNNITLIRLFQIIFYFIIVFIVIRIQVSFFKEKEVTNLITNFVVLLFIFMVGFVFVVDSKYDNHYKLKKNVNIKQIIELNDFKKSNFDKAFLCIDISSQYTNSQLKVLFNNEYSTNIKLQKAGTFFDTNFPLVYNDTLYKPHWIFFEIPLNIIKKTNIVNTVCNNANIYYSYNEKNRRLPSLFYYKHGINDIIFGPFSDVDKRCYSITIVNSLKRETFINDVKKKYDAHIFLLLKENGDYYLPKKYKKFNDVNIKYIALVNPIDRKLVFWSKTNPGKEFMKIYGNLYLYVAGEIDRFYSGYHFY